MPKSYFKTIAFLTTQFWLKIKHHAGSDSNVNEILTDASDNRFYSYVIAFTLHCTSTTFSFLSVSLLFELWADLPFLVHHFVVAHSSRGAGL